MAARATQMRKAADTLRSFLAQPRSEQTPRAALTALGAVASSSDSRSALRSASDALDRVDALTSALDRASHRTPSASPWDAWSRALPAPGIVASYASAHKSLSSAGPYAAQRSTAPSLAEAVSLAREAAELKACEAEVPEGLSAFAVTDAVRGGSVVGDEARAAGEEARRLAAEARAAAKAVREGSERRVEALGRQEAAAEREMEMLLSGTIAQWIEAHPDEARMLFDEIESGDWDAEIDDDKAAKYAAMRERVRATQ